MSRPQLPIKYYEGPINLRAQAKREGLTHYFTGMPCSRGHVAERLTGNGNCMMCGRERVRNSYHLNLAESRAKCRNWGRENRDKKLAWNAANAERRHIAAVAWRENNRERWRASKRNNMGRRRNIEGEHSAEDIADIIKQQRGRCAECRSRLRGLRYQVDHIRPVTKGGSNRRSNLQVMCGRCNRLKGNRDPLEHARLQGRLL